MLRTGLVAQGGFTPRRNRSGTSDRRFTFTTAVRMVVRVHNRTADSRTDTHMTFTSCLTDVNQVVVSIAHNSDRRAANNRNHSHLS